MKKFELDINDACWESVLTSVPESAGIYFAYACYRGTEPNSWFSGPLVYIGEADDLRRRLDEHYASQDNHEGLDARYERIWYTYALFTGGESDRKRCEAALIYKHKPFQNKLGVQEFNYPATVMTLRGETRGLSPSFTVGVDVGA